MNQLLIEKLSIEKKLNKLEAILNGNSNFKIHSPSFPIVEFESNSKKILRGYLDTVTVSIFESERDEFVIVPSEKSIEERLEKQIRDSWVLAKSYSKDYVKIPKANHKVVIQFNNRFGFYTGNSLGIALVISFIEELNKVYNVKYCIKSLPGTAFTGSINQQNEIGGITNEDIIRQKTRIIFYSSVNYFCIPKIDFEIAKDELDQLTEQYPNRNLKLYSIESFDDIFLRRDLINISKKSIRTRSIKMIKDNSFIFLFTLLIISIFSIYNYIDWDKNPMLLHNEGKNLFVKNDNNNILWKVDTQYDAKLEGYKNDLDSYRRIINVDQDDKNEVLITKVTSEKQYSPNHILCYNNEGKVLWSYLFKDQIFNKHEKISREYRSRIIDISNINNKKILYLVAVNKPLFPSAIYKLDLKTGKRLKGTLWHTGHIVSKGLIKDFNEDDKDELFISGMHNAYEKSTIFSVNLDDLDGQTPTTTDYDFPNLSTTEFNFFVLLPKTKFSKYLGKRINGPSLGTGKFSNIRNRFVITIEEGKRSLEQKNTYYISVDAKNIELDTHDQFIVARDSLVSKGILDKPYTDTKEYKQKILNNIKYWNGYKFVSRNEYLNKSAN